MDICRVRYFLAVCEHGTFTAAANACGVSQPAVTTGVSRLERAFGGRLFERRHPVRLTPFGAQMRPLLEALRDAADRVRAAIEKEDGPDLRTNPGSVDLLEQCAAAPHPAIRDGELADGAPGQFFFDQFSRTSDLRLRSDFAVELSQRAIRKFEWVRAEARSDGDNSSSGGPPDESTLSG